MASDIRKPAVAGRFYPGDRAGLERTVRDLVQEAGSPDPLPALGLVAPHAGYPYSGRVAARVFAATEAPRRVVIIGPNHTGMGPPCSIWPPSGAWRTPLGDVEVDGDLTRALLDGCPDLVPETSAHAYEHGIEVELPFLQALAPGTRLVAIVLGTRDPAVCERLGAALGDLVRAHPDVLLVASSDMNHFDSHDVTLEKDERALERVRALDPRGLLETCARHRITMCGAAPTAAVIHALRPHGLRAAEVLEHTTSGPVSGDYDRVVGYAGVRFVGG